MAYRKISILLIMVLSLSGPALAKDAPPPQKTPPIAVVTAPVQMESIADQIKAVGTVVPFQTVAVTSRIDSQIMAVKFNAGDAVKEGQALFILDDRSLKTQLAQAQATLQADRTQIDSLQKQFDRLQLGVEKGFSSDAERDNAKAALNQRKAIVAADEAAVKNIQVQLGYTVITAPIDGRTGTIAITVGNTVKANDTKSLVTINQIQPISIQASLPQDRFDAVRQAMQGGSVNAYATRDGSSMHAQGALAYIDNAIDGASGTFAVRATFPNDDEALWPGMLVNFALDIGKPAPTLTVPEVAVQHTQTGDFVFVAYNGKAVKKDIAVSRIQNGRALIAKGLQENEPVIVDGLMALKDGSAITMGGAKPADRAQP